MNRINLTAPKILIALLLCAAAGVSFANPGWGREKDHEREQTAERTRDQRRQARKLHREELRAQRGAQPNRQQPQQIPATTDKPKRKTYSYDAPPPANNGKMTPEERRALRRQINEANQTISQHKYP